MFSKHTVSKIATDWCSAVQMKKTCTCCDVEILMSALSGISFVWNYLYLELVLSGISFSRNLLYLQLALSGISFIFIRNSS